MKTRILLLSFFISFSGVGFAQKWVNLMEDPHANFFDVQKEFYDYWNKKEKSMEGERRNQSAVGEENEESIGEYLIFKRWEAEMQYQIDEKGNRIDPRKIYAEMATYEARQASEKITPLSASWTELGPRSWKATSGWNPGVGRIDAIAVDPKDNNTIYIGSPQGGVWKTSDGGTTWNSLTDGLAYMSIGSIAVDPSNSNTIYIGTSGAGMLKSTDGGATLTQINSGYSATGNVRRISIHPQNPNLVLIGTSAGVYRSTNGGGSWTKSSSFSTYGLAFKPGSASTVYACGTDFYKSTDGGVTFTKITSGITASDYMRIAVTPADSNLVCIFQCNGSVFGSFYKSTDSGNNFTATVSKTPNYMGYNTDGSDVSGGQGNYDMVIAISSTDPNEIYIGGIQIWKSTDGGTSFTCMTKWTYPNSLGYCHADMHALEYAGGTLYSGSDGGIYKSTDKADNFTDLSKGLGIRMITRSGSSKTNANVLVHGAQDNGASIRNSSGTWIDWLGADGQDCEVDPANANLMYGSVYNGSFYKTTNGGTSYTTITSPGSNGVWTSPLVVDKNSALYLGYSEIYKSTNAGSSFTQISNFGGTTGVNYLAISPVNPSYLYAAKGATLYKTTDGGANWSTISSGLGGATIARITVSYDSPDHVAVITTSSKVYSTKDGGATWTNLTGTLPAVGGRCIVYENAPGQPLYAGMTVGVYYRDSTMSDWVPYMTGLPKAPVNDLDIQYSSGKIRAATYGRGMWESDLYSVATSVKETEKMAALQVYPNPIDGKFRINFQAKQNESYGLRITNLLGETVYMENIKSSLGSFEKELDLSSAGKGIYFISLTGSTVNLNKKIIKE